MKKAFTLFISLGLLLVLIAAPASAATIVFDPASETIDLGTSVTVDLVISDLGEDVALGAFDLEVTFDPAILELTAVTFGDQLGFPSGFVSISGFSSSPTGTISLFEISLESIDDLNTNQADSFVLATLTFSATGAGVSSLDILNPILGDAEAYPLTAEITSGSITVTAVPVPAVLVLFGSGLIGLFCGRKKERCSVSA